MHRLDDLLLRRALADEPVLAEPGEHSFAFPFGVVPHLVNRLGEHAQARTQVDVFERQVPGGGRKVVGIDGDEGFTAQIPRLFERPVPVCFEPENGGSEDPSFGEVSAHPRLDVSEVFADDDGARPIRLEHEDADHRLVVESHIRAVGRIVAFWNPPQAEKAHDVVDPKAAGVPEDRSHHVPQGGEGHVAQSVGPPRGLRPVLSVLVVHVRRRAHGHPLGKGSGQGPHVGSHSVDSDGEIVEDAELHSGFDGVALGLAQLRVDDPLKPSVKVDPSRQIAALTGRLGSVGMGELLRKDLAVLLPERAPEREVLEPFSLGGAEALKSALARLGPAEGVDDLQRLKLGRPGGVAVDRLVFRRGFLDLLACKLHERAAGPRHVADLVDVLGADVYRIEEASGDGKVRRGSHVPRRLGRMKRVDKDEVAPEVAEERAHFLQIGGVAYPP